jgi:hypothetical protein
MAKFELRPYYKKAILKTALKWLQQTDVEHHC